MKWIDEDKKDEVVFGFFPKITLMFTAVCLLLGILTLYNDFFKILLIVAVFYSAVYTIAFYLPEKFQYIWLHSVLIMAGTGFCITIFFREGKDFFFSSHTVLETIIHVFKNNAELLAFSIVLFCYGLFGIVKDWSRLKK